MEFEKICMVFTMQEPYYGILLSSMDRVETKQVPTIGVGRAGNVFKLYYNPDFIASKTIDETLCLLKHETCHLAFNHFTLFEDLDVNETTHAIANIAADMEVNSYIDFSKVPDLIKEGCKASDIGLENGLGGREYFRQLLKLNQQQIQQANSKQPNQPCNGGQGGQQDNSQTQTDSSDNRNSQSNSNQSGKSKSNENQIDSGNDSSSSQENVQNGSSPENAPLSQEMQEMKSLDEHDMWPKDVDKEFMNQIIDDMLVFAAEEVEKSQGHVPSELVGKVDEIRKRKPRPVADWKRYFRRYLGNEFSELIRKSKKRESRRFPDAAGNRHRRKSHILVAIDTSGSVSMPEYREFFGQIRTLTKDADFHVVECDAIIQHEYDYKGQPNLTLHGHGGTRFEPVIDKFIAERRKYDALVYFTDGEASIPSNTPKDTLWVISSKGDHNKDKYKVNGASVVIIPNKETA